MKLHYSYSDLGYGVLITNPKSEDAFLQGDDAELFLFEVEQLKKIWENGNPNPKLFHNCEDLFDNHHEIYFL